MPAPPAPPTSARSTRASRSSTTARPPTSLVGLRRARLRLRPGHKAAAYIAKRVPKGKVLVIGGPPVPSITNYTNCFVKAAKKAGLQVVGKQNNVKDTAATAQPIVQDLMTKHPDVNAIWCYNDPSCLGAGAVVRSSGKKAWVEGKQKGIVITGANGSSDAAQGVKSGLITGTWDPQAGRHGHARRRGARDAPQGRQAALRAAEDHRRPDHDLGCEEHREYVDPLKRKVKVGRSRPPGSPRSSRRARGCPARAGRPRDVLQEGERLGASDWPRLPRAHALARPRLRRRR